MGVPALVLGGYILISMGLWIKKGWVRCAFVYVPSCVSESDASET